MGNIFSYKRERSTINFKNGDYYEGEIMDDLEDGLGIKLFKNLGKYEGFFYQGKRNGKGRMFYENEEFYMGKWIDDKINGFGEFFYSDHTRYSGEFKNGKKHGMGVLYNFDNSYYKGNFDNNLKDGMGEMIKRNKKVFDQIWDKGRLVSEKENLEKIEELKKFEKDKINTGSKILEKNKFSSLNLEEEECKAEDFKIEIKEEENEEEPKKKNGIINGLSSRVIRNAGPETLSIIDFKDRLSSLNGILKESDIKKWSICQVAEFITSFGLVKYKKNFINNKICGKTLLLLSSRDFVDLGITVMGDNIILRELIRKLVLINKNNKKLKKKNNEINQEHLNLLQKNKHKFLKKEKKKKEEKRKFLEKIIKEESSASLSNSISKNKKSMELSESTGKIDIKKSKDFLEDGELKTNKIKSTLKSRSVNYEKPIIDEFSSNKLEKCHSQESLRSFLNASIYPNCFDLKNNDLSFESSSTSDSEDSTYPIENGKRLEYIEKIGPNLSNFILKKEDLILQNKIGEGAYGEVYLAKYFKTDVAIKIFDRTKFKKNIRKKFIKEAEILCSLRSPFIVLFMGVCLNYKNYMLVTEYMEQGSLYTLIHTQKIKMTFDKKLSIIESISHGMNHLHENKVLHCDLKSSNILIMDNYRKVKLCDFGLSTVKNKLQKRNRDIIGTPNWMAPEILRGEKYDEASDVFSFGMVIWEILTEKIPYNDLSIPQIVGSVGFDFTQQLILPESTVCLYRLKKLMETCLSRKSKLRPSFDMIVEEIDLVKEDLKKHKKIECELQNFFG